MYFKDERKNYPQVQQARTSNDLENVGRDDGFGARRLALALKLRADWLTLVPGLIFESHNVPRILQWRGSRGRAGTGVWETEVPQWDLGTKPW